MVNYLRFKKALDVCRCLSAYEQFYLSSFSESQQVPIYIYIYISEKLGGTTLLTFQKDSFQASFTYESLLPMQAHFRNKDYVRKTLKLYLTHQHPRQSLPRNLLATPVRESGKWMELEKKNHPQ